MASINNQRISSANGMVAKSVSVTMAAIKRNVMAAALASMAA